MIEIKKEKNMGQICWPNTGRGESHIPGALHCRSSTCLNVKNNIELTDTKGHIAFNEPIPY